MTRVTTNTPMSHLDNAGFRAWVGEFDSMMQAAGLVRTSDTGQMDPTTATRPGTNTNAGYLMYRANDPLQATMPIFLKFFFGTATTANAPRMQTQLGQGSDGAGNLTGLTTSLHSCGGANVVMGSGNFPSYAIHRPGLIAMAGKLGLFVDRPAVTSFVVQRTCDNNGDPTPDGVALITPNATSLNTSVAYPTQSMIQPSLGLVRPSYVYPIGFLPGDITTSKIGGNDEQIYLHWLSLPEQRPLVGTSAYLRGELNMGFEFDLAVVGNTPRRYLCVGPALSQTLMTNGNTVYADTAILWED